MPGQMGELTTWAQKESLWLLAQVHTHPTDEPHSSADEEWSPTRRIGFMSVVIPFGAQFSNLHQPQWRLDGRLCRVDPWQAPPVTDENRRNAVGLIPPALRPRVVLRYADSRELFVSGLLDGGDEIAQRPAVIDAPTGNGHVLLFSTNPFWRGQTKGSYMLVFNAIMNWDNLNAGRKLDPK